MHRKLGAVPLLGGAATPSNTTSPGPRFASIPSGILIHPAIWPQQTWAENWEAVHAHLGEGELVPIQYNVARAEAYLHAKFHLDPSNRLATVHQRHK